jgi:hypothetical protein
VNHGCNVATWKTAIPASQREMPKYGHFLVANHPRDFVLSTDRLRLEHQVGSDDR